MTTSIAIHGLGRIGRALFRIVLHREDLQVVAVNDRADPKTLARLINYDSVHGRLHRKVVAEGRYLVAEGRRVAVFEEVDAARVPWQDTDAQVVVDASGTANDPEAAQRHRRGAVETVLVSALMAGKTLTLCPGVVGLDQWAGPLPPVISAASCTTHGLALLLSVLERAFGVEQALMSEVHAYTGNQRLLDGVHEGAPRRERSAAVNIVPTTTAAPGAVERLIPSLRGRLLGQAIRVPTPNVALLDLVVTLRHPADVQQVCSAFEAAASGEFEGVLGCSDEPLVSTDFVGDIRSAVVDLSLIQVLEGGLCRVVAWYDNEWGYANRLADFLIEIGERI